MVKTVIKFAELGQALGLRRQAVLVRSTIKECLNKSEFVIFDFEGVDTVSNSFADECFGKLVEEVNMDALRKGTTFKNTNVQINFVIQVAFKQRLIKNQSNLMSA